MDASAELLSRLESGAGARDVRSLVASGIPVGFGQAYFQRVAHLSGSDPAACRKLTRLAPLLLHHADRPEFILRAEAAGLRLDGRWAQAGECFVRAGTACPNAVDRLVFSIGAVDSFARAGQLKRAITLGRRLAKQLEALGETAAAARARLNLANALSWADQNRAAAAQYRAAREAFEPESVEWAIAQLGLSTSSLYARSAAQAEEWALEAERAFLALEMPHYALLATQNVAHAARLQGRPEAALEIILKTREQLSETPADAARTEEFLGDIYLQLNLWREAEDAYQAALASPALRHMPANRANCLLGAGMAAKYLGRLEEGKSLCRKAAQLQRKIGNPVWHALAMLESGAKGKELAGLSADSAYVRARIAVARLEAGTTSMTAARAAAGAYPDLAWQVYAAGAKQAKNPLPIYRRMIQEIVRQRLTVRSTAAALRYLADKEAALGSYLALLLREADSKSIAEAVDLVTRLRSAALLDEILGAQPPAVTGSARLELEQLRSELAAGREQGFDGIRSSAVREPAMARWSRRWHEAERRFLEPADLRHGAAHDVMFAASGQQVFRVDGTSEARLLAMSLAQIEEAARWIEFELFAPLLNPDADWQWLNRTLADLKEALGPISGRIAPEGALWSLPWTLLAEGEPVMCLTPAFSGDSEVNLKDGPVVIWAHGGNDLPNVEQEVQAVRSFFPDALVCRTSEEARRSLQAEQISLLHVAGHARCSFENPMFSYLEFGDGPLLAADIARSPVRIGAAVLNACDTGKVSVHQRYEPDGLVRSVLARGAGMGLASLWPVSDEAAADFAGALYQNWLGGALIQESVAQGRLAVKRRHPYYWGTWALFAGYSKGNIE